MVLSRICVCIHFEHLHDSVRVRQSGERREEFQRGVCRSERRARRRENVVRAADGRAERQEAQRMVEELLERGEQAHLVVDLRGDHARVLLLRRVLQRERRVRTGRAAAAEQRALQVVRSKHIRGRLGRLTQGQQITLI